MILSRKFLRYFLISILLLVLLQFISAILLTLGNSADITGIIVIGFIPIVFGSSSELGSTLLLFMLSVLVFYILFVLMNTIPFMYDENSCSASELDNKECDDSSSSKSNVSAGAVIMLGPIPIVIGSGNKISIVLAYIAFALVFVFLILFTRL